MTPAFLSQGLRPQEGLTLKWRTGEQNAHLVLRHSLTHSLTHTEGTEQTGPRAGSVQGLGKLYKTWLLSARTQSVRLMSKVLELG